MNVYIGAPRVHGKRYDPCTRSREVYTMEVRTDTVRTTVEFVCDSCGRRSTPVSREAERYAPDAWDFWPDEPELWFVFREATPGIHFCTEQCAHRWISKQMRDLTIARNFETVPAQEGQ